MEWQEIKKNIRRIQKQRDKAVDLNRMPRPVGHKSLAL